MRWQRKLPEKTVPSLPTGTVTFLFTDIEGSTRLMQRLGDAYADILVVHRPQRTPRAADFYAGPGWFTRIRYR
jgi:hypothetical protein